MADTLRQLLRGPAHNLEVWVMDDSERLLIDNPTFDREKGKSIFEAHDGSLWAQVFAPLESKDPYAWYHCLGFYCKVARIDKDGKIRHLIDPSCESYDVRQEEVLAYFNLKD